MKKLLSLLAITLCCSLGQASYAQNVEGQLIAAQYGEYVVPGQYTGSFQFPSATCQVSGGGKNFDAFAAGVAIKIVDSDPTLTEIATPSSVFINQCVLNMATSHTHVPPYFLTSGTGGLQEAILYGANRQGGPNTVILNAEWYTLIQPRSAATVIASITGNANVGLVDVTTSPYTAYTWNGSAYTQPAPTNVGFPITLGSTSIPASSTTTAVAGLKVINGVSYSAAYTGATVDVRVNACILDAMVRSNGNTTGICDASGETGIQNTAAQINIGNSSGVPVTLIVPSQGQWRGGMTDGTSCTVNQFGNTSILGAGPESGIGTQFVFGATAGSSLACVFKLTPLASQLNYIHDSNFAIVNVNGGPYTGHVTTGGIGANFVGPMFDSSTVDYVVVFDALDAIAAQVSGFCCGAVFRNMSVNGNYGAGVTPLVITNTSAFNLETLSVVHPGAGQHAIQLTDSTSHTSNVSIHGLYIETSNSDTTTSLVQDSGYGSIDLCGGIEAKAEVASDAAPFMTSTSTTNTGITFCGFHAVNGAGDFFYPVTVLNNSFTGEIIKTDNTSAKGNLGFYTSVAPFLYSAAGTPLPTCGAAMQGKTLNVSDATTPTYLGTYASGGAVKAPVFCNGSAWVTF